MKALKRGPCQASWVLLVLGVSLVGIMVVVSVFRKDLERFTQGKMGAGKDAPVPFDSPEQSLFILGNNTCSPSCCPSTYSCSGGCVCLTDPQKKLLAGQFYYPPEGPAAASGSEHASVPEKKKEEVAPDSTAAAIKAAARSAGMIKQPSFAV